MKTPDRNTGGTLDTTVHGAIQRTQGLKSRESTAELQELWSLLFCLFLLEYDSNGLWEERIIIAGKNRGNLLSAHWVNCTSIPVTPKWRATSTLTAYFLTKYVGTVTLCPRICAILHTENHLYVRWGGELSKRNGRPVEKSSSAHKSLCGAG